MKTYLLQAPRDFVDAGIPKGYMLQVISSRTGTRPDASEVRDASHLTKCLIQKLYKH